MATSTPTPTSLARCYRCQLSVPPDSPACPNCRAGQSGTDRDLYEARLAWKEKEGWFKVGLVVTAILCLGVGVLLGRGIFNPSYSQASPVTSSVVSWSQVNNAFVEHLSSSVPQLGITNWVSGPTCEFREVSDQGLPVRQAQDSSCGIVIEIAPPARGDANHLWQTLDRGEREAMVGFLAAAYTRALQVGITSFNPERQGTPRLELRYRGHDAPLAIMENNGRISLFPSPFDDLSASSRERR